jgi:hypothetical protein
MNQGKTRPAETFPFKVTEASRELGTNMRTAALAQKPLPSLAD